MKELHNNIFSNTTCISKEIMLKYINNQLSESELHEVEKHIIDCDLCTNAIAGMKFAKNSSILFALDHEIDKRTEKGLGKTTTMKKLMVAASILIVVSGSYFTYNLFNNSFDSELAINNKKDLNNPIEPDENFILPTTIGEDSIHNNESVLKETEINKKDIEEELPSIKPVLSEEVIQMPIEDNLEVLVLDDYSMVEEVEVEEELVVSSNDMDLGDELEYDDNHLNIGKDGIVSTQKFNNNFIEQGSIGNSDQKIRKKVKSKSSRYKPQNTTLIEGYKVYDYTIEYENAEEFKKSAQPQSIPPSYSTFEAKELADKEFEKTTLKITYQETLEKGIHYFKLENYTEALIQFDLILSKHPKDVNALFYGGLSHYQIKEYTSATESLEKVLKNRQTEFNQEAEWHNALTLIELKKKNKVKKILQKIIDAGGFYKTQAIEKLEEL